MATRNERTEIIVGLFVLVGLILLGWLVVQFGRLGERFLDHYPVTVVFEDASGVIKGSDVRMGGAKIGRVAETPTLNPDLRVAVPLSIRNDIRIPVGSKFSIGSASLLGDRLIQIAPPTEPAASHLEAGAEVTGAGVSGLEALQTTAEAVSESARDLMARADVTMEKIDVLLEGTREATATLSRVLTKVDDRIFAEENLDRFDRSLAGFESASSSLAAAGETLPEAIAEAREAFTRVSAAAVSAETAFTTVSEEVEGLRPAIRELPAAVANISRAADKAGDVMAKVESGDGLIGVLTDDEATGTNAADFIRNLRRYGILRYRDDATEEDDPRQRFRGRRR